MAPGDDDSITLILGFPKKMSQCMKTVAASYLHDTRIKPQYLTLIYRIGSGEGISQKELNEDVPYDKSYISTMVHDLIELGLVYNDSSGKLHCLRLTDQGRDIYAMSRMMFDLIDRSLFDVLTEEERSVLNRVMVKLDSRVDQLIEQFSNEKD